MNSYFTLHATRDELNALPAGEYGYMLFLYGERVESAAQTVPETANNGASVPVDSAEVAVCPRDTSEALTAADARADAVFGAYLCNAPTGFDEQEFRRTPEQLRASFRRGYDYVEWSVRAFREEDRERLITVVAETEQYNPRQQLYSRPSPSPRHARGYRSGIRQAGYDQYGRLRDAHRKRHHLRRLP